MAKKTEKATLFLTPFYVSDKSLKRSWAILSSEKKVEVLNPQLKSWILSTYHVRKLGVFFAKAKIEEWRGALKAWYVGPRSKKGRFFHFWYRLGFKMQRAPQSAPFDIFLKKWFFHKNVQFSLQCKAPPFWEGRLNRFELQSMDSRLSPE